MRTVLLRHDLRDGSSHFDWLIQRPGGTPAAEEMLISFRTTCRIDTGAAVDFLAEPMPDHRSLYLTFEGEISGGRGTVTRVAEGDLRIAQLDEAAAEFVGHLGAAAGVFRGVRENGFWRYRFEPRPPGGPPIR
jgi:hypothetical protein